MVFLKIVTIILNEMKFVHAPKLKQIFDVYGHFYNLNLSNSILECRSILEIRRKWQKKMDTPDIIVMMMNPGSSTPINKKYKPNTFSKDGYNKIAAKEIVPARPDNTQYQIMRLMQLNNWDFVRILNLSDLRNGNSGNFQTEFRAAIKLDNSNPHCITHIDRRKELSNCVKSKSNKIIAAWGDIAELKEAAETILELNNKIIGIMNGESPYYRHASPYMKKHKMDWLNEIQSEINKYYR